VPQGGQRRRRRRGRGGRGGGNANTRPAGDAGGRAAAAPPADAATIEQEEPPNPPRPARSHVVPDGPRFDSFDLLPELARSISDAGFERCTPIQAQTLPFALTGRDVAGQAQTGTGKTAAFLVSMFQTLMSRRPAEQRPLTAIRGIVIAPTRE